MFNFSNVPETQVSNLVLNDIHAYLNSLRTTGNRRLLYSLESGSRAWGFASPDSDYDVRFIYVNSPEWYFEIDEHPTDTISLMQNDGLYDFSGWELRKTLRLFSTCNLALNEWFDSPIVYGMDLDFHTKMRELIPAYFNPMKSIHHYLALHHKVMALRTEDNTISIKKLFYAIRSMLAALWSWEKMNMPPTQFKKLLEAEFIDARILEIIQSLWKLKIESDENYKLKLPTELLLFFDSKEKLMLQNLPKNKKGPGDTTLLNQILFNFVNHSDL